MWIKREKCYGMNYTKAFENISFPQQRKTDTCQSFTVKQTKKTKQLNNN